MVEELKSEINDLGERIKVTFVAKRVLSFFVENWLFCELDYWKVEKQRREWILGISLQSKKRVIIRWCH